MSGKKRADASASLRNKATRDLLCESCCEVLGLKWIALRRELTGLKATPVTERHYFDVMEKLLCAHTAHDVELVIDWFRGSFEGKTRFPFGYDKVPGSSYRHILLREFDDCLERATLWDQNGRMYDGKNPKSQYHTSIAPENREASRYEKGKHDW